MNAPDLDRLRAEYSQSTAGRYRPGARLGQYELLLLVGAGGMAAVWVARLRGEAGFSKLVAIKTILPHLAGSVEVCRMLHDEARIGARVHHPNVVTILELGEDRGVPYMVMEWVNGVTLDRLLQSTGKRLAPRLAARIVADACAGLHAAHELTDDEGEPLCVVHRDISPHNLMLSLDGAVKLTDFGIVKANGQSHSTTSTSNLRGRISYMAPEQVTGAPVDRRSDIFALGATLHETLTGKPAFPGHNSGQLILKIARAAYEPPRCEPESLKELFGIAKRALSLAPGDRFATAESMRRALDAWLTKNAPPIVTRDAIAEVVEDRVGVHLQERQARVRMALSSRTTDPMAAPTQSFIAWRDRDGLRVGTTAPVFAAAPPEPTFASAGARSTAPCPQARLWRRTAVGVALLAAVTAANVSLWMVRGGGGLLGHREGAIAANGHAVQGVAAPARSEDHSVKAGRNVQVAVLHDVSSVTAEPGAPVTAASGAHSSAPTGTTPTTASSGRRMVIGAAPVHPSNP